MSVGEYDLRDVLRCMAGAEVDRSIGWSHIRRYEVPPQVLGVVGIEPEDGKTYEMVAIKMIRSVEPQACVNGGDVDG